jgi:amidase
MSYDARVQTRFLILAFSIVLLVAAPFAQAPDAFRVEEATIAGIHAAMRAGRLTCRTLVQQYLRRIEAFDKNGPAINAIVQVNPDAITEADDLDRRVSQSTLTGPLHCVPVIVKDNF